MSVFHELALKEAKERSERGYLNRARGHSFEIKVANFEKLSSDYVSKQKGSLGTFDIVSFKKNGKIRFVSCKTNGYHCPSELVKLKAMKEKLERKHNNAEFVLAYYVSKKKWIYESLK